MALGKKGTREMNANELIKRMEDGYSVSYDEITAMLRQQQAEIEALKGGFFDWSGFKKLTDEEIANTWDDVRKDATLKPSMKDMQDFARAILRKAQEK